MLALQANVQMIKTSSLVIVTVTKVNPNFMVRDAHQSFNQSETSDDDFYHRGFRIIALIGVQWVKKNTSSIIEKLPKFIMFISHLPMILVAALIDILKPNTLNTSTASYSTEN